MNLTIHDYKFLIKLGFKEDLYCKKDITTDAIFNKEEEARFLLVAKEDGILCGKDVFSHTFLFLDKNIKIKFNFNDGDTIKKGETIAEISGKVVNILKAERTALNFLTILSGIATKTSIFVKEAQGKIRILDTRKTLPGYRKLFKYAVKCGGGENHREGLFDMILIKDNHIDAAGGIKNAVSKVREKWGKKYKIVVEARNLEEVKEALSCKVDRIMLDNMELKTIKEAIRIINNETETEISGGVTLDKIKELANTKATFVSIGELTHTIKPLDFTLIKKKD